jgi:hypothetical protein
MKKFMITSILLTLFATGATLMAQNQQEESLGLPGDNLNLYAVMKVFQESETLEGFERSLNDQNSQINNLDLNGDNLVDYIRVIDNIDGDVHNIVLQVAINRRENQDVAVFTVQRDAYGKVYIQLTGDEALYGRNYIIEPILDEVAAGETANPGYVGNSRSVDGRNVPVYRTTTYEIAAWPVVRYIYMPAYVGWHSSWYYDYYPSYWHPWQPFYWHYYYGYHYNWYNDYYSHYRLCDYHRYNRWNDYYWSGRRSYSTNVSVRIQAGNYRNTYSRPELRSEGEATFIKSHPDQPRRAVSESSVNSTTRRSASQSVPDRQSGNNGTARRSTTDVTNRSVTNPQTRQNDVTTRRSTNTETNRSVSNPQTRQNDVTTRRSTNTVTNRSVSNPQTRQNDATSRRSTNTVTNRSVSNPQSEQTISSNRRSNNTVTSRSGSNPQSERTTVSNRTSKQSSASGDNTSARRSSESNKSSSNSNNSGRTRSSENTNSSRRK